VQGFAGQLFASLIGTELLVAIGTGVVVVLLVVTWSREVDG
jgi:glycerol uptake facilitator-like aquaporin